MTEPTCLIQQTPLIPLAQLTAPKAILFDLDDCLTQDGSATQAGVDALFASHPQLQAGDSARYQRWAQALNEHYPAFLSGGFDGRELIRRRMATLLQRPALGAEQAEAGYQLFYRRYIAHTRCFPEVTTVLAQLKTSGVRLGMITNGPEQMQRDKVAAAGLTDYFPMLLTAEQAGAGKPSAQIFNRALQQMSLDAGEAWYIGDSLMNDALGAAQAGLSGIWLNRPGPGERWHLGDSALSTPQADSGITEISSLGQLRLLLENAI